MIPSPDRYEKVHRAHRWQVPARFNLYDACCARWAAATPDAVAIIDDPGDGTVTTHRYADLQRDAVALSRALARLGVGRGDRVAIVVPQRLETAVAHLAIHCLGSVAVPLSTLFGADALAYRLNDSGARVAIVDAVALAAVRAVRADCPALAVVMTIDADATADTAAGETRYAEALRREGDAATAAASTDADVSAASTDADDAAVLIYTSGTTGPPKGALIPHRALLGNLPGFVASQNGFPVLAADTASGEAGEAVFWSPADWAWTGGLMDALLPTLYFGRPIVASRGRFQPEAAFALLQRHRVTHAFLFPTALKAMMKAVPAPRERYTLCLQGLMSAGEAVGDAVFAWCRDALGVPVNEMFGQTEVNYIVGNSHRDWPARPGSMGRAYPGHRVAVLDDAGRECPRGTAGDVALHRLDRHGDADPVFFLGYWKNDAATLAKYTGDPAASWCRTGDMAVMDADGYLWYQGRSDDMFKAAGYRIGPSEVENCLVKHPAVANAAVVPKPDAERGALVKAYVVLASGFTPSAALIEELQQHVRGRLAPYEYPKEIEFIDALPMTTTGKVQRRVLRLREEERARGQSTP